eukprot:jgi/Mesvir1/7391/Mv19192-RA.1
MDRDNPVGATGSVASVLREARASLKKPSRPFTPADPQGRKLFHGNEYPHRPVSAVQHHTSRHFLDAIRAPLPPIQPLATTPKAGDGESRAVGASGRARGPKELDTALEGSPRIGPGSPLAASPRTLDQYFAAQQPSSLKSASHAVAALRIDENFAEPAAASPRTATPECAKWFAEVRDVLVGLGDEALLGGSPAAEDRILSLTENLRTQVDTALQRWPSAFSQSWTSLGGDARELVGPGFSHDAASDGKGGEEVSRDLTVRQAVLCRLFAFMDLSSSRVLLRICSVSLKIVDTLPSVTQLIRLVYKLSKDPAHDTLFRHEKLVDPLLTLLQATLPEPLQQAAGKASGSGKAAAVASVGPLLGQAMELLVYMAGAIKNVSNDAGIQRSLASRGAVALLAQLITHKTAGATGGNSSSAYDGAVPPSRGRDAPGGGSTARGSSSGSSSAMAAGGAVASPGGAAGGGTTARRRPGSARDSVAQLLVQVTGVLRNLAVAASHAQYFAPAPVVASLAAVLRCYPGHAELTLNVARILSKLSMDEGCRAAISHDPGSIPRMLESIACHPDSAPLVLRVAFVLGNITVRNDDNRVRIAAAPGAMETLTSLLVKYNTTLTLAVESLSWPDAAVSPSGGGGHPAGGSSNNHNSSAAAGGREGATSGASLANAEHTGDVDARGDGGGTASGGPSPSAASTHATGGHVPPRPGRSNSGGGASGAPSMARSNSGGGGGGGMTGPVVASSVHSSHAAAVAAASSAEELSARLRRMSPRERRALAEEAEAVVVKLVRLFANLAIHGDIGPVLSESQRLAGVIAELLRVHTLQGSEELILNVISAITNLSFYEGDNNRIIKMRDAMLHHLAVFLTSANEEAVVESARAFGNFSRYEEVRAYMAAARVDDALILLLDHSNRDILFSACGALMNVTAELEHKRVVAREGGVGRLVDVLDHWADEDLSLVCVVCKTLFNLSVASASSTPSPSSGGSASLVGGNSLSASQAAVHECFAPEHVRSIARVLRRTRRRLDRLVAGDGGEVITAADERQLKQRRAAAEAQAAKKAASAGTTTMTGGSAGIGGPPSSGLSGGAATATGGNSGGSGALSRPPRRRSSGAISLENGSEGSPGGGEAPLEVPKVYAVEEEVVEFGELSAALLDRLVKLGYGRAVQEGVEDGEEEAAGGGGGEGDPESPLLEPLEGGRGDMAVVAGR